MFVLLPYALHVSASVDAWVAAVSDVRPRVLNSSRGLVFARPAPACMCAAIAELPAV